MFDNLNELCHLFVGLNQKHVLQYMHFQGHKWINVGSQLHAKLDRVPLSDSAKLGCMVAMGRWEEGWPYESK